MKKLIWLLVFLVTMVGQTVSAATYYTALTGGDNTRSCATAQSVSTPKQSVNSAIGCLVAGDTLLVKAGTYAENITSIPSGTSWVNKVRIAAYASDTVLLKPTTGSGGGAVIWLDCECHYIEIDHINLDGNSSNQIGLWVSTNNMRNPHHVRIQNADIFAGANGAGAAISFGGHTTIGATGSNEALHMTLHGGGIPGGGCGFACNSYGIYLEGPNNLVDGCEIYGTRGAGIQVYNAGMDSPSGNIIRNTKIHDITATEAPGEYWGIIVIGPNTQIYNVVIYNMTLNTGSGADAAIAVGCATGQCGDNTKVWNVTIYNAVNGGVVINGTTGVDVKNTLVYGGGGAPFSDSGTSTTQDHNMFSGVNPLFVNPGAGNFSLQAGSPAINTGVTLAGVPTDFLGILRPQASLYDIGAFEFVTGGGPTAVPSVPTGLHIIH